MAGFDYETAKRLAFSPKAAERLRVARAASAPPEILYHLARDADPRVLQAVAANPKTPEKAYTLLLASGESEVRLALAQAIPIGDKRLNKKTTQALDALAHDSETPVRQRIAETVRASLTVPKAILKLLALDTDSTVAKPVLRHTPQFVDVDFIDVIEQKPDDRVVAIAEREDVSDAVLDLIEEIGPRDAKQAVAERKAPKAATKALVPQGAPVAAKQSQSVAAVAEEAIEVELIDNPAEVTPELFSEALRSKRYAYVYEILAARTKTTPALIRQILNRGSRKAILAIAWRAGYDARVGFHMQIHLGMIPAKKALSPKEGAFPIPESELIWQWNFHANSDF